MAKLAQLVHVAGHKRALGVPRGVSLSAGLRLALYPGSIIPTRVIFEVYHKLACNGSPVELRFYQGQIVNRQLHIVSAKVGTTKIGTESEERFQIIIVIQTEAGGLQS